MLWAGGLLGVSFVAAPAKFWAPSLTLPVALDVGRHTFQFFNKLELVALAVLTLLVFRATGNRLTHLLIMLLGLLLLIQTAWLLPLLDQRVTLILKGEIPAESHLHLVYIGCDVCRLIVLAALPWRLIPFTQNQSDQP